MSGVVAYQLYVATSQMDRTSSFSLSSALFYWVLGIVLPFVKPPFVSTKLSWGSTHLIVYSGNRIEDRVSRLRNPILNIFSVIQIPNPLYETIS